MCKDVLKLHAIYAFQIPLPLSALSQELDLSKLLMTDGQWTQSALISQSCEWFNSDKHAMQGSMNYRTDK